MVAPPRGPVASGTAGSTRRRNGRPTHLVGCFTAWSPPAGVDAVDEDIVAIIAITLLLGIPVLAISARIALKPIAEAISKLRGDPVHSSHARGLQDRRLVELEEQMDRVVDELSSLQEAIRFQQSLAAGPVPDDRPTLTAMPPEPDRP